MRLVPPIKNLLLLTLLASSFAAASPIQLRTDHLTNPIGIDSPKPQFAWQSDATTPNWTLCNASAAPSQAPRSSRSASAFSPAQLSCDRKSEKVQLVLLAARVIVAAGTIDPLSLRRAIPLHLSCQRRLGTLPSADRPRHSSPPQRRSRLSGIRSELTPVLFLETQRLTRIPKQASA